MHTDLHTDDPYVHDIPLRTNDKSDETKEYQLKTKGLEQKQIDDTRDAKTIEKINANRQTKDNRSICRINKCFFPEISYRYHFKLNGLYGKTRLVNFYKTTETNL